MAEYIDRAVCLSILRAKANMAVLMDAAPYFEKAAQMLEKLSTADVAPVLHGRWDNVPNTYMSVISKDGAYHGNATTCSVCHEVNPNAYKTNFCPNCGAKMDIKDGGDNDAAD